MKKLILMFALLSTQAFAQPATPEQVASECITQMQMGMCRARPDRAMIAPGQTMLISGVGRVSYAAYLDFADLNDEKYQTSLAMCYVALIYMTINPNGDHAKVARALWSPTSKSDSAQGISNLSRFEPQVIAMAIAIVLKNTFISLTMNN